MTSQETPNTVSPCSKIWWKAQLECTEWPCPVALLVAPIPAQGCTRSVMQRVASPSHPEPGPPIIPLSSHAASSSGKHRGINGVRVSGCITPSAIHYRVVRNKQKIFSDPCIFQLTLLSGPSNITRVTPWSASRSSGLASHGIVPHVWR